MKIREHRGAFVDSMATVAEIEPTREAIAEFMRRSSLKNFPHIEITADKVHVDPYVFDNRIGWDTHIVLLGGYGVFGFTDGPVND